MMSCCNVLFFFFFQAEDGIRDLIVTGVQTCALPISGSARTRLRRASPRRRVAATTSVRAGLELVAGVVDGPLVLDLGDPPVHRDPPPGPDPRDVPAAQPDQGHAAGAVPQVRLHREAGAPRAE